MKRKICFLLFIASFFFGFSSKATVVYVDSAHVGGIQNGTSWATAFSNFQAGIDAASAGDSVWVAKGIYIPPSGISFSMKDKVQIYGGFLNTDTAFNQRDWHNNITTLKGNNNRVIYNQPTTGNMLNMTILSGFIISGGKAEKGGGIYNFHTSPTINNCVIESNQATGDGGGMYNESCTPTITNCTFIANNVSDSSYDRKGGGICNANTYLTINGCTFSGNFNNNGRGGAIFDIYPSSILITNSAFIGNSAVIGGGIFMDFNSPSEIASCYFSGNSATGIDGHAGAIFNNGNMGLTGCSFTDNHAVDIAGAICNLGSYNIKKCSFSNNTANRAGGALYNISGDSYQKISNCKFTTNYSINGGAIYYINVQIPEIINSVFFKNVADSSGSGIFNKNSFPKIVNCTMIENKSGYGGSVIQNINSSVPDIANTIIWGNNNEGVTNDPTSNANIKYSLVQGVIANSTNHNIDGNQNPGLIDTALENYQLTPTSLCINAGLNQSVAGYNEDILNNSRIYNTTVDLGSYEFYIPSVNLGGDTTICLNDSLNLNAHNGGSSYLWSTGDTTQNIWVHTGGTYFVTATNIGGISTDTIHVITSPDLIVNLGNDASIDQGSSITLNAGYPGASHLWSTGATTQTINVTYSGTYSVVVTNNAGCTGTDTIIVSVNPLGINDVNTSKNSLIIYPNPTKETIHISFTDEKLLHTKAMLTDIYGRTVREIMLNSKSQELSMAGLSSGIYILKTITGNSVKIVKQ